MAQIKSRKWVFTLNNYTREDEIVLKEITTESVRYLTFGYEIGEEGTPHLQGFVWFKNARRFKTVKQMINPRAHVEKGIASPCKAVKYCHKDGDFYELGEAPVGKGKRTDIDIVKAVVVDGGSQLDIWDAANSYQAFKMGLAGLTLLEPKRTWKPLVLWFHGPTGSGKTRTAFEMYPDAWISMEDLKWWEGYDGHDTVILDDFRGSFCKLSTLLRILDRYPMRVPVKGGSRQLIAHTIIITSCHTPEQAYSGCGEAINQLIRRIDEVRLFEGQLALGPEV